jgi:hypothetical protein
VTVVAALKPWHVLVLMCCFFTVTAVISLVVVLVARTRKPKQ